jgi:hypothetical protein
MLRPCSGGEKQGLIIYKLVILLYLDVSELILAAKDLKSSYSFSNGNSQILEYYNKVVQMIKKYNTD